MSWTKQDLIDEGLDNCGLSSYTFKPRVEDYISALRKLDNMMSMWHAKGIYLAYPVSSNPNESDLSTVTQVPDWAIEAIASNLAIRIAPSFGKTVSAELKSFAKESYDAVLIRSAESTEMQFPETLHRGAGNKQRYTHRQYFPIPYKPNQPWDK